MAQVTINVDEPHYAHLGAGVAAGSHGGLGLTQFKALEKEPPGVINGIRIIPPTLILGIDQFQVPARGERRTSHKSSTELSILYILPWDARANLKPETAFPEKHDRLDCP